MTAEEMVEWVTERYGSPFIRYANGVFVAVVPLLNAKVSVGFGSSVTNAVYDLYCELVHPTRRQPCPDVILLTWERERVGKRDNVIWGSPDDAQG